MGERAANGGFGLRCVAGCLWPAAIPLALGAIYAASPSFYFRYILEHHRREYQFVEIATVSCAVLASAMMFAAGARAWQRGTADRAAGRAPAKRWLDGRGGAAMVLFLAAATFFFAGEEVNWGQTYLGWETQIKETNLHNSVPISFPGLGSLVIALLLIGVPLAWRFRERLPVPRDWEPAVAEWPVACCVLIAFAVSWVKDIARLTLAEDSPHAAYFFELNEQKELLVAVALLMYGVNRVRKLRPARREA